MFYEKLYNLNDFIKRVDLKFSKLFNLNWNNNNKIAMSFHNIKSNVNFLRNIL